MTDAQVARQRQSHIFDRNQHDFYIEPLWCSYRLFDVETFEGGILDPACGSGRIVQSARDHGIKALGSDIVDRFENRVQDFFEATGPFANVVSNPPFGVAQDFANHALVNTKGKVALLLPLKWLAGGKRSQWMNTTPLRRIWVLCPRPSMPLGDLILAGIKPGGGTSDFAWLVWEVGYVGQPELRWLHRDGDR